ncbi:MAG: S8 family serine peptidase [Acidobacteriota bacterium]
MPEHLIDEEIGVLERPRQFAESERLPGLHLVAANRLIRGPEAREDFDVDGSGLSAAVLDTGLRVSHVDFAGRVSSQVNFTDDNGGDAGDASDGHGHGTNVGGIVVADGLHEGVAPGGSIVPLKVMKNTGAGSFRAVHDALEWIVEQHEEHAITVVCMSLSGRVNHQSDQGFADEIVRDRIRQLREKRIAVVVAAGNDFFTHGSRQGMAFPAILRECVSVGAVYDSHGGPFSYGSGARAAVAAPDRVTPFSQRLHESVGLECRTDIFAPGAPIKSAGIENDRAESEQQGTSQATPVVAGVLMLLQQLHRRETGELPEVEDLVRLMRNTAVTVHDGENQGADNVVNTGLDFPRVDAFAALLALEEEIRSAAASADP